MTEYLLAVHGNEDDLANVDPAEMEQAFADVAVLNEEIQKAGAWVFAGGLHPSSTATVVTVEGGETIITDGPYLEAKEHLGGFWVIQAADLDEALGWAAKATVACQAPVEVRPFQSE